MGWTYYQLVNEDSNTSNVKDHANALSIPFGAGVSVAYNHFTVDARFTYRSVFDDDLVRAHRRATVTTPISRTGPPV